MFRVNAPFVAVWSTSDSPGFITIQADSLITVTGEVQESGLVEIMCEGQTCRAFIQDIRDRSELA